MRYLLLLLLLPRVAGVHAICEPLQPEFIVACNSTMQSLVLGDECSETALLASEVNIGWNSESVRIEGDLDAVSNYSMVKGYAIYEYRLPSGSNLPSKSSGWQTVPLTDMDSFGEITASAISSN